MMLRQAHSISWGVLEGTFCGSEALCVIEQMDLPGWGMSWPMLRTVKQPHNPSLGDEKLSLAEWIGK
eukprot:COSAG01_NODE_31_length_35900_cov_44.332169_24_plen_67_part_00